MGNIIAFSGTHGTGKSNDALECARCLRITHRGQRINVLMENVENCPIDKINKQTTIQSQLWIFTNQIQAEITAASRYNIVVCDRTAVDAIAYTSVAGFEEMAEHMIGLVKHHMHIYRHIYFKSAANNNFHFDDGFRDATDKQWRLDIESALLEIYRRLGFKPGHKQFEII